MLPKIQNFFLGAYEELRKVIWPSRKEVTSHTVIVILSIVISMGIVIIIDYLLFNLLQYLINR
jgi:preprotein translocase subunit SecE